MTQAKLNQFEDFKLEEKQTEKIVGGGVVQGMAYFGCLHASY